VWSYPVDENVYVAGDPAATNANVSQERVALNMINAVLGRIHLASRIQQLDEGKQALIREAVDFYKRIAAEKLEAVPYFPKGYAMFGDTTVVSGIRTDKKAYLAVWNLRGERDVTIPLPEITAKAVSVAYPTALPTDFAFTKDSLTVHFTEDEQARIFAIELN